MLEGLLKMLESGRDSAMLRLSLGQEYARRDEHAEAIHHLRAALEQQADYSAAWKALGRSLDATGDHAAAIKAFGDGIRIAEEKGDRQAAKEMSVFLRRIEKRVRRDSGEKNNE